MPGLAASLTRSLPPSRVRLSKVMASALSLLSARASYFKRAVADSAGGQVAQVFLQAQSGHVALEKLFEPLGIACGSARWPPGRRTSSG